jgi:hypothetical protein
LLASLHRRNLISGGIGTANHEPSGRSPIVPRAARPVSKVLDKLEAKRLASRTTSQLDSRVQLLSLTARARRLLAGFTAIADSNDRHFFAALDADEQASLRTLLRKLAETHQMMRVPVD